MLQISTGCSLGADEKVRKSFVEEVVHELDAKIQVKFGLLKRERINNVK